MRLSDLAMFSTLLLGSFLIVSTSATDTGVYRMSRVPYLLSEVLRNFERELYDQQCGIGLLPSDFLTVPHRSLDWGDSGVSKVSHDKEGLKINLDVQQFKPEELNVKVVDDYVVIEGKHEERSDKHGFVSRHFTRRYKLPDDVDKQALNSTLSSDGVLQLYAPRLASLPPAENEQPIPIIQTNKPAIEHRKKEEKPES